MKKEQISTDKAPGAIGPYSQGVRIGRFVFVSGQIPVEPGTGEVLSTEIGPQTRQVLRNLQAVLEEARAGMKDVVKTTVYLQNISMFAQMNSVYAEFFNQPFPARATVEVSALPKGVLVEIDAVAVVGDE